MLSTSMCGTTSQLQVPFNSELSCLLYRTARACKARAQEVVAGSQGVHSRLKRWDVWRAGKSESCGQLRSLCCSLCGHTPTLSLS